MSQCREYGDLGINQKHLNAKLNVYFDIYYMNVFDFYYINVCHTYIAYYIWSRHICIGTQASGSQGASVPYVGTGISYSHLRQGFGNFCF